MRPTIVYVHPHLTMRTGATNFVLETATGLKERGYPVVIVTGQASSTIVGNGKLDIVELGGPLPSDPEHWLGLVGLEHRVFSTLDRIPHKILFPQVHPANYWAFAYKAVRRWVPCVWMCQEPSAFVHSWGNIRSLRGSMRLATIAANPMLQVVDRLLVARADQIIANSQFTSMAIRRIYRRDADAIAYPPINDDAFLVADVPRDCILHLGRLTHFKRVEVAIEGYAMACRTTRNDLPRFVIAGSGPEESLLRKRVALLGLEERVQFLGEVTNADKCMLYARAMVFVATCPLEPFGLVCPEAMAAGVPVLAPDKGGSAETVVNGKTGAHYRAGDPIDLARMLRNLLCDPNMLAQMGDTARRRVKECYTLEHTLNVLERTFAGIRA